MAEQHDVQILERPITQEEVAKKAGVSRSIVSRILSNAPDSNISPFTRSRVLEASRELNYRTKTSVQRHHNIVVGLFDLKYINRYYFATIISGIARQAGAFDFDLQFLSVNPKVGLEQPEIYFLNRPSNRNVKGYIIIDQAIPDEEILKIRDLGIPFVMLDREIERQDFPCVLSNEEKVMYDLTTYLLNRGRKNIAYLFASRQWNREKRKEMGIRSALEEYGMEFSDDMIFESAGMHPGVELTNLILKILNKNELPSAIVCARDDLAVKAIELALDLGLRVPQDVAITGYHDTEVASIYPTAISSVRIPLREMGETAIVLLENLIEGKEIEQRRIVLEPEIIVRDSC